MFGVVASLMLSSPISQTHHDAAFGGTGQAAIRALTIVYHPYDPIKDYERVARERRIIRQAKATARAKQRRLERETRIKAERRTARLSGNTILAGLLDLPRLPETAPIDGCAKVNTGLSMGGGFMVFTCEKLLPSVPITRHEPIAYSYAQTLKKLGWTQQGPKSGDETTFTQIDEYGCQRHLSQRVWTDRAMNEARRPVSDRDAYRQIVFLLRYSGKACQRYYELVKSAQR